MHKIDTIIIKLIHNKLTHHHISPSFNPHVPPPYFPQYLVTTSPSAHSTDSSILLALQKQWERQERNQMEKQKEERKRMKEEREQKKEDRK